MDFTAQPTKIIIVNTSVLIKYNIILDVILGQNE